MNKNLILSVILCFCFTGVAFAQSGAKSGSSSRGYSGSSKKAGSSSKPTRADKELASAKSKLVRQMTRRDFEAVKLNKDQKKSLMSMVDSKFSEMVQLDNKIAGAIPSDQVKALRRAFRNAKKDGSTEEEAMTMSMEKIGLPEMVQEKVMMMNQSKVDIRESIKTSIVETFDEEQQEAFAASMAAAKKEMMGEEMADKEMADKEMDGKKEMMDEEMADKEMTDKEMKDKEMPSEKEMSGEKKMIGKEMAAVK